MSLDQKIFLILQPNFPDKFVRHVLASNSEKLLTKLFTMRRNLHLNMMQCGGTPIFDSEYDSIESGMPEGTYLWLWRMLAETKSDSIAEICC